MSEFSGKTAFVTGAASGIGAACARWLAAQGMSAPEKLSLATRIEVLPGIFVNGGVSEETTQNRFRLSVPPDPQVIVMPSRPAVAYAAEIRYNGAVVHDALLEVSPGAAAHRLEVSLDNRAGSVSGDVTDGSRPAPGATISVAPEHYRGEMPLGQGTGKRSVVDPAGHFEVTGLAPGDYRILATKSAAQDPDVLLNILSSAPKITIAPGSSQSVNLRITNLN